MENKQYTTRELFCRFAPYFKKYRFTLCMDLFCAALTTVCELVLPLIMRYITNEGLRDLAALSVKTIFTLGILYFGLRIIICRSCPIPTITIPRSVRSWGGSPMTYSM